MGLGCTDLRHAWFACGRKDWIEKDWIDNDWVDNARVDKDRVDGVAGTDGPAVAFGYRSRWGTIAPGCLTAKGRLRRRLNSGRLGTQANRQSPDLARWKRLSQRGVQADSLIPCSRSIVRRIKRQVGSTKANLSARHQ
jgi:hypothetical protein